jgi:hypothetical protein
MPRRVGLPRASPTGWAGSNLFERTSRAAKRKPTLRSVRGGLYAVGTLVE